MLTVLRYIAFASIFSITITACKTDQSSPPSPVVRADTTIQKFGSNPLQALGIQHLVDQTGVAEISIPGVNAFYNLLLREGIDPDEIVFSSEAMKPEEGMRKMGSVKMFTTQYGFEMGFRNYIGADPRIKSEQNIEAQIEVINLIDLLFQERAMLVLDSLISLNQGINPYTASIDSLSSEEFEWLKAHYKDFNDQNKLLEVMLLEKAEEASSQGYKPVVLAGAAHILRLYLSGNISGFSVALSPHYFDDKLRYLAFDQFIADTLGIEPSEYFP